MTEHIIATVGKRKSVLERFCGKFIEVPSPRPNEAEGNCWEWTAYRTPEGYGRFGFGGRSKHMPAHCFAYQYVVGPIPEGRDLDHRCRNRACVNPDHLRPTTKRLNTIDGLLSALKEGKASKYTGVTRDKQRSKWLARMMISGKRRDLGRFTDERQAGQRYQEVLAALTRLEELSDRRITPDELATKLV